MLRLPVYMDYHATTPVDPVVLEAMLPYFNNHFGNAASRGHEFGWRAAEAVRLAREEIAASLHAEPDEIIFTSGATESINLAIKGAFELLSAKGNHIITLATEHRAVLDTCNHLEKIGAEVSYLPVGKDGLIDISLLESTIRRETILIVIMIANNETGVIQPVRSIGEIARAHKILFFTDATQALGKIPVDLMRDEISLLACSAHKIYGPKGIGALFVRRKNPRVRLIAQMDGGGQERGFRSGTLNVPGIVGFGKAAALAEKDMNQNMAKIGALRNKLEASLLGLEGAILNGHQTERLATVTNISFSYPNGNNLLENLLKQVAVSSGSACSSATPEPSHVLKAMGLNDSAANQAIRFSLGKFNTEEEVDFVIDQVRNSLIDTRMQYEKIKI